jgi:hypothetical protein
VLSKGFGWPLFNKSDWDNACATSLRASKMGMSEGTHIKYRATAHYLKIFCVCVLIDDRNSKLEGKLIAAVGDGDG